MTMNDKERETLALEVTRQAKLCSDILKEKGSSCLEFIQERAKLEKMKEELRDEHKRMIRQNDLERQVADIRSGKSILKEHELIEID